MTKFKISPLAFKKYLQNLVELSLGSVGIDSDSVLASVGGLPKRVKLNSFRVDKRVDVALEDLRKGSTSPSINTIGTSPAVRGYEFSQTGNTMQLCVPVPFDYSGGKIEVRLSQLLVNAETGGDLIEWDMNYIVLRDSRDTVANGEGGVATKTSTALAQSTAVVDNNGNGYQAGTAYETVFEIDPGDADNPFDKKNGYFIYFDISRTTIGGTGKVGSTLLTHAYLKYK